MAAARRTLERSTMMLLTTSKACLRHPDCQPARDNRDTVFAQMRRAMDLIHFVVKEGIIMYQAQTSSMMAAGAGGASGAGPGTSSPHHFHRPTSSSSSSSLHLPFDPHNEALLYGGEYLQHAQQSQHRSGRDASIPKYQRRGQLHRTQRAIPGGSFVLAVESTLRWLHEQLDTCPTIVNILRRINELLDLARMGPLTGPVKEQIVYALDAAIERTQDFTDSAYTNHEHRERILLLCDQIRTELGALFRVASCLVSCSKHTHNSIRLTTVENTHSIRHLSAPHCMVWWLGSGGRASCNHTVLVIIIDRKLCSLEMTRPISIRFIPSN